VHDVRCTRTSTLATGPLLIRTRALGIPPSNPSELSEILDALDPDNCGYATYEPFVSICALKLHTLSSDTVPEEVETAYNLFTKGGSGPITLVHLRRIARELKEDVSDELLRDMINEANGGAGVHKGVDMMEFRHVMSRAGGFS
jgi:Ca2+-binding EF-hand superfamily protein